MNKDINIALQSIEKLRGKLNKTTLKYGLQNKRTIMLSQELDVLLNEYDDLNKNNRLPQNMD